MIPTNSWCMLMFFFLLSTFDPSCWQRLEWSYWYRDRRRHHHLHQASNEHGLHGGWSRLVLRPRPKRVVSASPASPGWLGQRCWAQKTEGEGLEVAKDERLEDWWFWQLVKSCEVMAAQTCQYSIHCFGTVSDVTGLGPRNSKSRRDSLVHDSP